MPVSADRGSHDRRLYRPLVWAIFTLFPLYWTVVTSIKAPWPCRAPRPTFIPWVDFEPTLDAFRSIFGGGGGYGVSGMGNVAAADAQLLWRRLRLGACSRSSSARWPPMR